jgi:hypothetical protein
MLVSRITSGVSAEIDGKIELMGNHILQRCKKMEISTSQRRF